MVSGTKSKPSTSPSPSVATGAAPPSPAGGTAGPDGAEGATDLAALKGGKEAPAPEDPAAADKVVQLVQGKMGERHVSDDDARAATAALSRLTPGQARAALEELQKSGALDELAQQVPDDARRQLVDTMIRAGFIGSEAGRVLGGSKAPAPPQAPVLACRKSELSPELSEMLRDENLQRLRAFQEAFTEYRADYQKAVRGVGSFEQLRALGPIAEPQLPAWEPGTGKSDQDHEWSRLASFKMDVETGNVVTATVFRLNGRKPPGTDFAIEATLKASFPGGAGEVKGSVAHKETRDGSTETEVKVGSKHAVPTPLGTQGVYEQENTFKEVDGEAQAPTKKEKVGVSSGSGPGGVRVVTDGKNLEVKGSAPAGSVAFSHGKKGSELKVDTQEGASGSLSMRTTRDSHGHETTALKGSVGVHGVKGSAGVDSDGGVTLGAGASRSATVLGGKVEGSIDAELTLQLHSVADYRAAFATVEGTPFSNPPPELARGVRWERLSEEQQAAYALYGWGKERWQAAQKSANLVASARSVGR